MSFRWRLPFWDRFSKVSFRKVNGYPGDDGRNGWKAIPGAVLVLSTTTTSFSTMYVEDSVFFRKAQLFKNTVSKTHFFTHVKKDLFQKKMSFLVLGNFC